MAALDKVYFKVYLKSIFKVYNYLKIKKNGGTFRYFRFVKLDYATKIFQLHMSSKLSLRYTQPFQFRSRLFP